MFEKRREARQTNRRHSHLMRIADEVVRRKEIYTFGMPRWDIDELTTLFIGRAFADLNETVDATEAANYVTAALAKRGVTIPSTA